MLRTFTWLILTGILLVSGCSGNTDPDTASLVTDDIDRFWEAFDAAEPDFGAEAFRSIYLDRGSVGVDGFMENRIRDAAR